MRCQPALNQAPPDNTVAIAGARWVGGTYMNKQPRDHDRHLYKERHLVESFFARLKQYRAIATRCDKTASNFLGAICLAASMVWPL